MKKRLTAILLSAAMTLTAAAPALAADSVEKLLPSVKARAGISDEYTDFSSDYSENNGYTEYRFSWSDDGKNRVFITYNSDDVITSYSSYNNDGAEYSDDVSLPKVSLADAKTAAQAFVDKLNPGRKGEFIVEDPKYSHGALNYDYSFDIIRIVNGAEVSGNTGNISVSREDSSVSNMYINYTPAKFADISNKISADAAKKAYEEKLGTELVYLSCTDDEKITAFPVYVEKTTDKYIDALTGEVFEIPETSEYGLTNDAAAPMAESQSVSGGGAADKGLSKVEEAELDKIAGLISSADIEARIRANETLAIPDGITLQSIGLTRNYYNKDEYTYSLSFSGEGAYANVGADAKTGEITMFNFYDLNAERSDKVPDEEEIKAANAKVFEALAGSVKSEYKYVEDGVNEGTYTRFVNGIKVRDDMIRIHTNNDGRLTYYNRGYTKADFPSISGAMSAADAADKMHDAVGYDVKYLTYYTEDGYGTEPVYMHGESGVYIDPFTGERVNYRNEPYAKESAELSYSDIEGHYAQDKIETLADYGIGFEGGKFRPDEKITQKDYLYMLTKTFAPYIEYADADEIYKSAESGRIMTDIDRADDSELTRETAAVMMIRMMDAEKYAKLENIYAVPFDDVTENIGYIAILYGMNVINGDGKGHFNPDSSMTRAEAACMIYRYLTR